MMIWIGTQEGGNGKYKLGERGGKDETDKMSRDFRAVVRARKIR